MRPRRKTIKSEYSSDNANQNSTTTLRQMSITESFKKAKLANYKAEKPFFVSDVVIVVDSDSDVETPPEWGRIKCEPDVVPYTNSGERIKCEPDVESYTSSDKTAPSPAKKPKTTIGVHLPGTSTPKSAVKTAPHLSRISALTGSNNLSPIADSPRSNESSSPNRTLPYDYTANTFDATTVPFSPRSDPGREVLILNDPKHFADDSTQNAVDILFPLTSSNSTHRIQNEPIAKRRLFDDDRVSISQTSGANRSLGKQQATNNNNVTSNDANGSKRTKNINKKDTPSKTLQPSVPTFTEFIFSQSPKQLPASTGWIGKDIPSRKRKCHTEPKITSNKENSKKLNVELSKSASESFLNRATTTENSTLKEPNNVTPTSSSNSVPPDKAKSKKVASARPTDGAINNQVNQQCLKTSPFFNERNASTPKKLKPNSRVPTIASQHQHSFKKAMVGNEPSTSTLGCPNIAMSQVQPVQKVRASNACGRSKDKPNTSTAASSHPVPSKKVAFGDKPSTSTAKANKPSTSTSRVSFTSQNQRSPKSSTSTVTDPKPSGSTSKSQTPKASGCTTPKKISPRGSPRKRGCRSPSKRTPTSQNREIKSLKAKEGKQLQVKQLDELVKLVKIVATNRHLRHILNKEEMQILTKLMRMQDNQKYVVMKLFVWKKTWYNIFKFCSKAQMQVDDDKDITDIFMFLVEEGFVDTDYLQEDVGSLLQKLDRAQVKEVMNDLRINARTNTKDEMIVKIITATIKQSTLTGKSIKQSVLEKIENIMGLSIKVKDEVCNALYHVYLLATFTNPDFDDIQFYFQSIIHLRVVFPEVPLADCPVFLTRDKFLQYADAIKLRRELENIVATKNGLNRKFDINQIGKQTYGRLQMLEPYDEQDHKHAPHLRRFTAEYVYSGVLWTCCENLFSKRFGEPMEVKNWVEYLIRRFPHSTRLGKWYRLLIRLHSTHLPEINCEKAAKLLIEVFETKSHILSERDKYELGSLGKPLRASRKHRINQMCHDRLALLLPRMIDTSTFPIQQIDHQCIRGDVGKKRVYIARGDEGTTLSYVEQVALKEYAEHGFPGGEHCEGSLVKALMMLYFWDIIYNPNVPGTFISTLQVAPLDFHTHYFYENRKKEIKERLEQISTKWSDKDLIEFGVNNWQRHSHESSAFGVIVNHIKQYDMVGILVTVIGRKILAKIFERLIRNVQQYSSGMPDLLIWNVDQKTHKFVEVKGEGDRLAVNQTLWLQYLKEIGASIEVCSVHSLGSKRKKVKNVVAQDDGEVASTSRNEDRSGEVDEEEG